MNVVARKYTHISVALKYVVIAGIRQLRMGRNHHGEEKN